MFQCPHAIMLILLRQQYVNLMRMYEVCEIYVTKNRNLLLCKLSLVYCMFGLEIGFHL